MEHNDTLMNFKSCSGLNEGLFSRVDDESVKRKSDGEDTMSVDQNGTYLSESCQTSLVNDPSDQTSRFQSDSWDMQLEGTGEEGCRLDW